jgi:hypothetical protein
MLTGILLLDLVTRPFLPSRLGAKHAIRFMLLKDNATAILMAHRLKGGNDGEIGQSDREVKSEGLSERLGDTPGSRESELLSDFEEKRAQANKNFTDRLGLISDSLYGGRDIGAVREAASVTYDLRIELGKFLFVLI